MRRRTLLVGIAATLAAAGCSRSGGSSGSRSAASTVPPGAAPVVSWSLEGGLASAGLLALRPPRLAIYPKGDVIADATYRSNLTTDDIAKLLGKLTGDLEGHDAAKRRNGATPAPDAPTTVLRIRSAAGTYSASAAALDELRDSDGYVPTLYDARDRIAEIHSRVVSGGQPYTAARVRLVTMGPSRAEVTDVLAWPPSIEIPRNQGQGGVGVADLGGDAAREVMRLQRDLDLTGSWQAYRTGDGRVLCASWRYLLPDE